jgi:hypothetical protein
LSRLEPEPAVTAAIRLSLATVAAVAIMAGGSTNAQQRESGTAVTRPATVGAKVLQHSPRMKPRRRTAIMNELVESPVRNLNYGDADSAGFFQMRQGVLQRGTGKQVTTPASSVVVSPRIAVPSVRAR